MEWDEQEMTNRQAEDTVHWRVDKGGFGTLKRGELCIQNSRN
jgi:hypothetical protein